jgi:hypothetical protein
VRLCCLENMSSAAAVHHSGDTAPPAPHIHHQSSRKASIDGYSTNVFDGKVEQMGVVAEFIKTRGFLPPELIETEVAWFYK